MVSYLKNAPAGIPGDITRPDNTVVEPGNIVANGSAAFPQGFGIPLKAKSDGAGFQSYDGLTPETAASFYGVLARSVPQESNSLNESFGNVVPNPDQVNDIVVRGYVNVLCTAGTPVRGGAVYIRIVSATGRPIGAFEANSDGGNSILQPDICWASNGKDSSNNAELSIRNIINAA